MNHDQAIVEQFTKQAEPFAARHGIGSEEVMGLIVATSGVSAQDSVLDVGCGPGLVACAMAEAAQHVTGIDITPAMIDQARRRQTEKGLTNLAWHVGRAFPLPYADGAFSLVITRYTFHHYLDPRSALSEMVRVCRGGGKIVVIDATPEPDKADAYNEMERLRDPSHTRAMAPGELVGLVQQAGLTQVKTKHYLWEAELERLLGASFPNPGDQEKLRRIFADDLVTNRLGMGTNMRDGSLYLTYPTLIVVATKPA